MTTFADVLSQRLRGAAGQPLVTAYDEATGERTELSVTTYANWVAKTSSFLVEEMDLVRGDRLRIDLPAHWLGPVFLGAAWLAGLVTTEGDDADAVVCGPTTVQAWAGSIDPSRVVACSLLPMAVRFASAVPARVRDFGIEVWSQPDAFVPWDPPAADDLATDLLTHEQVWRQAAAGSLLSDGGRLLSEANPTSPSGLATFTEPLVTQGSLVLVTHAVPARLDAIFDTEQCTARFPAV